MFKAPRRKFYGQKQITLWLHRGVYDKAGSFCSGEDCPISTAVKQQFTNVTQVETTNKVIIEGITYSVVGGQDKENEYTDWGCADNLFIDNVVEHNITCPVILQRRSPKL